MTVHRTNLQDRDDKIAMMFLQGVTLAKIGDQFGLTRERVRQILRKIGVRSSDGGASKRSEAKRAVKRAKSEAYWLSKYGMPFAHVKQLQADGVTKAYQDHRRNAAARGIEFRLSFIEWFSVWQSSGKLDQRGRGKGKYVMSRIKDHGCYELGNVHIQLFTENSREATKQWIGKPRKANPGVYLLYPGTAKPWFAKIGQHAVGRFESEEEAAIARSSYAAANPGAARLTRGRGYSHIKGVNGRPDRFQVMVSKEYVGTFRTPDEALAARNAYLRDRAIASPDIPATTEKDAALEAAAPAIVESFKALHKAGLA